MPGETNSNSPRRDAAGGGDGGGGGGGGDDYIRLRVRPFAPADRPRVDQLIREGLLPGYVEYESRAAERIRASLGSERERFLVAEADDGRIVGTLAVVEAQPDVGHLHWLRVDPQWQQPDFAVVRALRRAAAEHARDVGLLKLAMHVPAEREGLVAAYCHQLGFELSRTREIEGVHVLEFYLNLYEQPELGGDAP